MIVEACGGTTKGLLRDHNEDNIYVDGAFVPIDFEEDIVIRSTRKEAPFSYAVFDGVGGGARGEQAAMMAIEALSENDGTGVSERIQDVVLEAHKKIAGAAKMQLFHEMGTTIALLIMEGDTAFISNLGDSRVYLFRDNQLSQVSHDHTKLQYMIDYGLINETDYERRQGDHALTQYAGIATEGNVVPSPYVDAITVCADDVFILCSDGITSALEDKDLELLLQERKKASAEEILMQLINKALINKSNDNVSSIVVKVK